MKSNVGIAALVLSIVLGAGVALAVYAVTRSPEGPVVPGRTSEDIRALGRCAQCHARETPGLVEQYLRSPHASAEVSCLECHREREGLDVVDHHGFRISVVPSAGSCRECHRDEYDQFARSRHAVPAMAAVTGPVGFSDEALAVARQFHAAAVDRPPNSLPPFEGSYAAESGCLGCHNIGRPHGDGSVGNCSACHGIHLASGELATLSTTCGSCHMGPDHAQLEIWSESRHGVVWQAKELDGEELAPTCSTCHMSGWGENVRLTHDVGERLSTYLFAPISEPRPNAERGELAMREVCSSCHAQARVEALYERARGTVENTNRLVATAQGVYERLVADGCVTPAPWDEPVDYIWFELWHHYGRTAKHGAFMGGADYTQWHGNYEIVRAAAELGEIEAALRAGGHCTGGGTGEGTGVLRIAPPM